MLDFLTKQISSSQTSLWDDQSPIREELFGTERLEHHAESLAFAQTVTLTPTRVTSLTRRLKSNAAVLLVAYRASAKALEQGHSVSPAAEWLLDNYHLVEEQLRQIQDDLPPGYYRQLPKLAAGPFAGYPRVFGLAWAYVAHTDSLFDAQVLCRFLEAYQRVQPLLIGELWAVAITLRIVLVENIRRLAEQIIDAQQLRLAADAITDQLTGSQPQPIHLVLAPYEAAPLPEILAAQLAKRLRGYDPLDTPLRGWLEDRLRRQNSSIDNVVRHAMERQGASNVTMRNIITSMRLVSEIDWAEVFEAVSVVDRHLRAAKDFGASDFEAMDFATRNQYRTAIEQLARGTAVSEIEIADEAVTLAKTQLQPPLGQAISPVSAFQPGLAQSEPGHYLIGTGRTLLEDQISYSPPLRLRLARLIQAVGIGGYVSAIFACAALILGLGLLAAAFAGATLWFIIPSGILGAIPASEAAAALVNMIVTRMVRPKMLPAMELSAGVPTNLRTLVAVPVLLSDATDLTAQIEQLEVHHLSSIGGAVSYALLSDGPDAPTETMPSDADLIANAAAQIARLNASYPSPDGPRFLLLHRRRRYNLDENCWMGWERKRGKLHELNRLLRGASDTSFTSIAGLPPSIPSDVRYVITLDADTRLPRDTVRRLVGKMAHPLNHPVLDPVGKRVIAGYGILQPRVTPALPLGREGSLFQQVYSSRGGIDPYAAAVSDVYQDLFGEGSFTGKGIYDIDAFEAALSGRVPENKMLSHDLFEGIFARAGLASDTEVVEDFPSRYDVAAKRTHRWVRGDWQLWPWLFGALRRENGGVPAVGRWKMVDNLKRSLLAPISFAALVVGWTLPLPAALVWATFILLSLSLPLLLPLPFAILPGRAGISSRSHFAALASDIRAALQQIILNTVFLPDTAWRMIDAIARTAHRLNISHKHLLEWTTAAQAGGAPRPGIMSQYRGMIGGVFLGLICCAAAAWINPTILSLVVPFALLWLVAPAIAYWVSQPSTQRATTELTASDTQSLRLIARRTWRFFETFVTVEDNLLPPDNFQNDPTPEIAHRTSPTNIGLYLLSTVAARDMGWIGQQVALLRLEQTLAKVQQLPKFRGHLYNWYETRDLRILTPPYVSSVDSGNLAGHLIAVANACQCWANSPLPYAQIRLGLNDTAELIRQELAKMAPEDATLLTAALDELMTAANNATPDFNLLVTLAESLALQSASKPDLAFWTTALSDSIKGHDADDTPSPDITPRLAAAAALARTLALGMEFGFLLDPHKKLLSIGFNVGSNMLDTSCYDLLASESRLGSLFAIAKGDVDTKHWFRLGRSATPLGAGSALISWSGSMFEYLMPSLVMRAPAGSVLAQTNALIVARQQSYGQALNIPWGISESSYNARDLEMTYQYSNFGVPGLGLKRGLGENAVIAPYATGLATMVDPVAAVRNFARLATLGAEGRYGFHEALDFTRKRLPEGADVAIVRSFMAHHQGMTICAIANTVQNGQLRAYFHAEPMIKATELLLQERVPRDVATAHPRAEEVMISATGISTAPAIRHFDHPSTTPPTAHLLSNGRYSVMLTPGGTGYSHWRDMAITRWRADATQELWGSFIFARDVHSGSIWSAGYQPNRTDAQRHSASFSEHHAAFTYRRHTLTTNTEIVVSAEDDAEARRVSLVNSGRRAREVDLTSYAELVLAPPAADLSHPAFSKMFVVTDFLPELGVIIATRRRRSPQEPEVWAAHLAVVEGEETAPIQIETDRARFIGRGRNIGLAAGASDAPLSGTTGTVLDPIFSIRRRVTVPGGGTVRVTFWTLVAETSGALLELVDRHRDPSAFARAATLAWTRAQVQLRHMAITNAEAADFQRLAGVILQRDPRLRAPSALILSGAGPQSGLWQHSISGDLPIVLLRIDDAEDADVVGQVLSAHEYWRSKQLAVDLVILNERSSSYVQDLQIAIETAVRSAQSRPRPDGILPGTERGTIYALRADLMTPQARALLTSVARIVLVANRGSIARQMEALLQDAPQPEPIKPQQRLTVTTDDHPKPIPSDLEFFNGTGGFALNGREYVTILDKGQTTPAPWVNVIANDSFGFQVSADGSGFTWAENSRENQITPWSNDPVSDPASEAIYIRDDATGALWTPTALPIRTQGTYIARHGFGYTSFDHSQQGITSKLVQFVPLQGAVKITRLTLHNTSGVTRQLSITGYAELALGTSRGATAAFITTERDPDSGAIFARNPWNMAFAGRVAFADLQANQAGNTTYTTDRSEFLGAGGVLANPAGLRDAHRLSGRTGASLDPCAALQRSIILAPGDFAELVFIIGQSASVDAARDLIAQTHAADLDAQQGDVTRHWESVLNSVQITTPDRAMDILLNGWLLYQTLACRIWARAGFYQASGAYGFRDQLQDGMALTFSQPEMTRAHLLRAASRQFPQGDVQHWWLPHSGQGVRTRISDDRVWLGYGVANYIQTSADLTILDEPVAFIDGPALQPGAHDEFFQPMPSTETATLFEHCARGLDQAIALTGANGMPLIGTGDWNDGMNRVGEHGTGTSVWLGWLLIATLDRMAPLADTRDPARATRWRDHANAVRTAIERDGWDGEWYRRGTFDDGTPLGAAASAECRIDSIAQSWAVLSGAGDPSRARTAMASLTHHLIQPDPAPAKSGIALLFTPPFDHTPLDPGYVKGYPPGLRENGGQYSHAAMWAVLAFAKMGDGDSAQSLFSQLNPINHALTADEAQRYKVEPYVVAADVYSTTPHIGRGGWTWYTGSAGWMYRAGIEGILGLTRQGDKLLLDPCFPAQWPRIATSIDHADTLYDIVIENPEQTGKGIASVQIDGAALTQTKGPLILWLDGGTHRVIVTLGQPD